jgi:phosphoribosylformylglycinamidine cyclo-ligase
MAEHPGVMADDDYDLSGFAVAVVDRPKMIGPDKVREGDVLLGLASSGIHSNGYSLVRKVCVEGKTHYELRLEQEALGGESLQTALLRPTRIYVKPVLAAIRDNAPGVHALAHITGGGITENLNRALPDTLDAQVELGSWTMPPVIPFVCRAARLDEVEALKTFNCGLGMVLVVDPQHADAVKRTLQEAGETVFEVGRVVPGTGEVRYANEGALFGGGDSHE